jgi:hypothetical protein
MSDRSDKNHDATQRMRSSRVCRQPRRTPEQARLETAQARADEHSVRELYFLELAVKAPDEDSANALELYAYEAYKDALAITKEHDLEG